MEIILVRHEDNEITEERINDIRAALTGEGAQSNDMLFADAEAVKVGYEYVRVCVSGAWLNWTRRGLEHIIIDGTAYPLHGSEFARINCITSQEELDAAKTNATEKADELKDAAKGAYEATVGLIDSALQARLDRFDKEFTLQV